MGLSSPQESIETYLLPLPDMNRTDADVALIALWPRAARYEKPVDDPMFAAHKPVIYNTFEGNYTAYKPDHPVGLLGCAVQYQFCFTRAGTADYCTSLAGLPSDLLQGDLPDSSSTQLAVIEHMRKMCLLNDITNGPGERFQMGTFPGTVMPSFPDYQWILEAKGWESYAYAGIQAMFADTMVGMKTRDSDADYYTYPPSSPGEEQLCRSFRMRKGGGFA